MVGSKKKIYQHKSILDGNEAVNYLAELVPNNWSAQDFINIAVDQGIRAFLDVKEMEMDSHWCVDVETDKIVSLTGLQEVISGLKECAYGLTNDMTGKHSIVLMPSNGHLGFRGKDIEGETREWVIRSSVQRKLESFEINGLYDGEQLLFKPADIEALADTLNGKSSAEELRQELAALREQVEQLEQENQELKGDTSTQKVPKSALLFIARALELYQRNEPQRYTQSRYIKELKGNEYLHGFSERTIAGLLKEAKDTLEIERKKR